MALDPSISLGVRGAQINDPLDTVGKAVALSNALANGKAQQQQQQINAEQLKRVQMQNQQAQKAQAAEDDFAGIRRETNGNIDQALDLYEKRGGNPTYIAKMKEDQAKAVKALSDAHTAQWNEIDKKTELVANDLGGLVQEKDPTKLVQRAAAKTQEYVQNGILTPDQGKQHLAELQAQGPAAVQGWYDEVSTFKHLKDKAAADRAAAEEQRKITDEARKAEVGNVDVATKNAALSKTYMEQAGVLPDTPALAETKRHNRVEEGISNTREGREQQALNLRTKGSLGVLSDSQKSIAQKVAEGDLSVEQLSRLPDKEAIIAGALELNPEWTRNTFATKKAFTDPASKQSQNLGTISRIVGHIGRFEKNSEDLGVSPSMLIGKSLSGGAAAVASDAHAIAGELEKLVSGGVGSVGQIKAWQEELKSSRPGIRKAAIDEISQLIGSQYEGMQQTYKAGTGKDLPIEKYVSPEGRKWMADKGIAGVKSAAGVGDPLGIRPK